jgi:hypothetical protein
MATANQIGLFETPAVTFHGADFQPERDRARLQTQFEMVRAVCSDGAWRTLERLCIELRKRFPSGRFPQQSVYRQMRYLTEHGFTVERAYLGDGLYQYRAILCDSGIGGQ